MTAHSRASRAAARSSPPEAASTRETYRAWLAPARVRLTNGSAARTRTGFRPILAPTARQVRRSPRAVPVSGHSPRTCLGAVRAYPTWLQDAPLNDATARDWAVRDYRLYLVTVARTCLRRQHGRLTRRPVRGWRSARRGSTTGACAVPACDGETLGAGRGVRPHQGLAARRPVPGGGVCLRRCARGSRSAGQRAGRRGGQPAAGGGSLGI